MRNLLMLGIASLALGLGAGAAEALPMNDATSPYVVLIPSFQGSSPSAVVEGRAAATGLPVWSAPQDSFYNRNVPTGVAHPPIGQ